ncbi:hypothetical protein EDC96DRAFT_548049 [Choanephora cucurbitarum]|nr:hypothetical protein EDC96DRAFT_548049 [Choanephora cucurbitarum]
MPFFVHHRKRRLVQNQTLLETEHNELCCFWLADQRKRESQVGILPCVHCLFQSKNANQVVAQEGLTTKRGRPGTTEATLVKSHSSNQSRMTSFLSNQDNAMLSNQNAKDLVPTNSSDDSFVITDNSADINVECSLEGAVSNLEVQDSNSVVNNCVTNEPVEEDQNLKTSEGRVIDDFEEELLDDLDEEIIEQMNREAGLVEENRIKEDNKKDASRSPRPPKEYRNGTFWVHRKDPAFALRDQFELSSEILYQPRVFLWFPHHLVSDTKCLECTTPTTFFVKEWNTQPRARRITDIDDSFYLMTLRYRCTNKETPHTFNGYDGDLMRQLPRVYAKQFPANLTECSGISTKLAKLMRPEKFIHS